MRFFALLLTVTLLTLCSGVVSASASKDDNNALNETYVQFIAAFNTLDSTIIDNIYTESACYLPENQDKQIIQGRRNIVELYRNFFDKIEQKKASIDVDFRVIERNIDGNNATDIGYYLVRFHPATETEEPISEFAGKFVIVSKKEQGKWLLAVDTNNRADASFYFEAKPSPNLYYGRQFQPLTVVSHDHK